MGVSRAGLVALSAMAAVGLGVPGRASAAVVRYADVIDGGGVTATGNSLGLNKAVNQNTPGTAGSIGAFSTLDTSLQVGTFPAGTTLDWTKDASSATLQLPAGARVTHAELVWGGSYNYGGQDLTTQLNTPVTLTAGGTSAAVTPDPSTAAIAGGTQYYYTRSADVTAIVAASGAGSYTVGGVPATAGASENNLNAAGWTLAVAYARDGQKPRWAGIAVGGESTMPAYAFSGFCAAPGTPAGTVITSALEGDPQIVGDRFTAGPDAQNATNLSGPNNPANNFFASQINGPDGTIDTTGTFGSRNSNALTATGVSGARQGWDVTTIPLSGAPLAAGQTTLLLQGATSGDVFVSNMAGAALDISAPYLTSTGGGLDSSTVSASGAATLTIPLSNAGGDVPAPNVALALSLPSGVGLASFAVDGVPIAATRSSLAAGVPIGDIAAGASRTVTIGLTGDSAGTYTLQPTWSYAWTPCGGQPAKSETGAATERTLTVQPAAPAPPVTDTTTTVAPPAPAPPAAAPAPVAPVIAPVVLPTFKLAPQASSRAAQLLLDKRSISLLVGCGPVSCKAKLTAAVKLGTKPAGSLKSLTVSIPAGTPRTVRLSSTIALRREVRRVLKTKPKTSATIVFHAALSRPGDATITRTVTVKVRRLKH